jgi:hypothetical protein
MTHLRLYYTKMIKLFHGNKLLTHYLEKLVLNWCMDLDITKWFGWNFYQTLWARSRIGNNLTKYGEKNNETIKKNMLEDDKDLPLKLILLCLNS